MRVFLFAWIPVFLFVLALGVTVVWAGGNFQLAHHYAPVPGVSLGPSPQAHGQSVYRFTVGDRLYRSEGEPETGGYIPAGQSVTVYYALVDPRMSCLDAPAAHLRKLLGAACGFALLAASGFWAAIVFLPSLVEAHYSPRRLT